MSSSVVVIARLNNKTQPMDRGELFEDPLSEALEEFGLGEVTGGGTQLTKEGEVAFCDVEIVLPDESAESFAKITRILETCGAAKGSKLLVDDADQEITFGSLEGLGVYLNGTDLPSNVYQESDVNFVYDELNRLIEGIGEVQSHWQGPTETALYLYGTSFAEMQLRIQPLVKTYPLCQQCRIVQIA